VAIAQAQRALHTGPDGKISQHSEDAEEETLNRQDGDLADRTHSQEEDTPEWDRTLDEESGESRFQLHNRDDPNTIEDLKRIYAESIVLQPRMDGRPMRKAPQISETNRGSRTSIYASEHRRRSELKSAWTPKKLATVELSVAKMTVRFALESYKEDEAPRSMFSFLDLASHMDASVRRGYQDTLRELQWKQEQLKACDPFDLSSFEHVRHPRYDLDSGIEEGQAWELDNALLSVLRRHSNRELSLQETLNRISYNLMSAPVAPEVRTYEILLSRLSMLGHHNIADIVIESFLESHIRPNELIVPSILTHYTRSDDHGGFTKFLRMLDGYYGGLMLSKPTTPLDGVAAKAGRINPRGDKIIQLMTLDPPIYSAIIMAHLHFNDLPPALAICDAMLEQRRGPDLAAMVALLRHESQYGRRLKRFLFIWRRMRRRWFTPEALLKLDPLEYSHAREAFRIMLGGLKERGHLQMWHQVYYTALSRGFSMLDILSAPSDASHRSDEPTAEDDIVTKLRLGRKILEHRLDTLMTDFSTFKTYTMAARIILAGLPVQQVYALFESHAEPATYHSWKQERPWLRAEYGRLDSSETAEEEAAIKTEEDADGGNAEGQVVPTRRALIKRFLLKPDKGFSRKRSQERSEAVAAIEWKGTTLSNRRPALPVDKSNSPWSWSQDEPEASTAAASPSNNKLPRQPWSRDQTAALVEAARPVKNKKPLNTRSRDETEAPMAAASSVSIRKVRRPWARNEAAALVAAAWNERKLRVND